MAEGDTHQLGKQISTLECVPSSECSFSFVFLQRSIFCCRKMMKVLMKWWKQDEKSLHTLWKYLLNGCWTKHLCKRTNTDSLHQSNWKINAASAECWSARQPAATLVCHLAKPGIVPVTLRGWAPGSLGAVNQWDPEAEILRRMSG